MDAFAYSNSPYPIRADLPDVYREAWRQLANAGTWWTGDERVAMAMEVRNAAECELCAQRKSALSPFASSQLKHKTTTQLSAEVVDIVHRLTTDPSRLTESWLEEVTDAKLTKPHYVEIISVVVTTLCIDSFHRALGFELEPLPEPVPGDPTCYIPEGLETDTAWVPMIGKLSDAENDLWSPQRSANVMRAMSVVPDAVRLLKLLSAAQYVQVHEVPDARANGGRAIDRAQIEFIAARVSAINDCFY